MRDTIFSRRIYLKRPDEYILRIFGAICDCLLRLDMSENVLLHITGHETDLKYRDYRQTHSDEKCWMKHRSTYV